MPACVPSSQRFRSEIVEWRTLQRAGLSPLRLGLHDPFGQAVAVAAGKPIRHDPRAGSNLAVGETLERGLIVGLSAGEARAAIGLRLHQHQLLVRSALPPASTSRICTKGPSSPSGRLHQRSPQLAQPDVRAVL